MAAIGQRSGVGVRSSIVSAPDTHVVSGSKTGETDAVCHNNSGLYLERRVQAATAGTMASLLLKPSFWTISNFRSSLPQLLLTP